MFVAETLKCTGIHGAEQVMYVNHRVRVLRMVADQVKDLCSRLGIYFDLFVLRNL